jgi:Arginyl-tRNA synthetase
MSWYAFLEMDARTRFKKLEFAMGKSGKGIEDFLKDSEERGGAANTNLDANLSGVGGGEENPSEIYDKYTAAINIDSINPAYCDRLCGYENSNGEGELILWKLFRELSINEFKRIYSILGISFDVYEGESLSAEFAGEIVKILSESGLASESEGAVIVPLEDIKIPALIAKSDGTSLYFSRDIVTAILRMAKFRYDKMIYVVGSEQSLHFNQLISAFALLKKESGRFEKYPPLQKYIAGIGGRLVHVKFGRIIGMSTRKGNLVFLEDYINEAKAKAMEKLSERTNVSGMDAEIGLSQELKEEAALKIGLGAVIFNDLKTRRNMDVNFNWDNVLSFEGQTGPYLQYTASRINSLISRLTKGGGNGASPAENGTNDTAFNAFAGIKEAGTPSDNTFSVSEKDNDFNEIYLIAKQISIFKDSIETALNLNEPSIISSYILELASLFNKYYQNYRLIGRDYEYIKPRLYLLAAIKIVLINALKLLCVPILEKM